MSKTVQGFQNSVHHQLFYICPDVVIAVCIQVWDLELINYLNGVLSKILQIFYEQEKIQ